MDKSCYLAGMNRLWANFPSRASSEADKVVLLGTYWDEIGHREWVTNQVFDRATSMMLTSSLEWFPTIKQVITWAVEADREIDRKNQRAEETASSLPDLTEMIVSNTDIDEVGVTNTLRQAVARGVWDRAWAASDCKRALGREPTTPEIDAQVRKLFEEDLRSTRQVAKRDGYRVTWVTARKMRGKIEDALAYRLEWE